MKPSHLYTAMISAATLFLASTVVAGADKNGRIWLSKSSKSSKAVVEKPIVEIEQLRASQSRRLRRLDEDGDGSVSREEFRTGAPLQREERGVAIEAIEELALDAVEDINIKRIRERVLSWTDDGNSASSPQEQRKIIIRKAHGIDFDEDADVDEIDIHVDPGHYFDRMEYVVPDHWPGIDRAKWFDIVDANEDGVLDRDEVAGAHEQLRIHRLDQRFDKLDANKDGQLNDEDIDSRLQKLQALDEDGDGSVSHRELGDLMRLLGENRMIDQAHVIRLRRDNGHR